MSLKFLNSKLSLMLHISFKSQLLGKLMLTPERGQGHEQASCQALPLQ